MTVVPTVTLFLEMPFIYLGVISLIAIIITCYDKIAAKHFPGHRTPEATLLAISAIGGSVAMYLTMQIIRHKTQHKKFMIGIPVIFFIQLLLGFGVWYLWLR